MDLSPVRRAGAYLFGGFALVALVAPARARAAEPGIAVFHAAAWAPGDAAREGAEQFALMLAVAGAERGRGSVGVIGVGNRQGMFALASEQALRFFAFRGMPVARLARGEAPLLDPDGVFLDGGTLGEQAAAALLARCLQRFGPPPAAADPESPSTAERLAIRRHLRPFQQAFTLANGHSVALR